MTKCPMCKKETKDPDKTWKYGYFKVEAYCCRNCGTKFRDYSRQGKHSFTLKLVKAKSGRAFVKA